MEDKRLRSGTDYSGDSSWTFPGESEAGTSSSYLYSDQESSILSEFGWDLRPENDRNRNNRVFSGFDPIDLQERSDLAGSFSSSPITLPAASADTSGEASMTNQMVSSSSSDDLAGKPTVSDGKPAEIPSRKSRKKGNRRNRQPRFAFITKSDVDNLEDGYRWRKYGQKAVKNSPFPRSYYRCTNAKCSVKKRVERSYEDPAIVITTYEGQHSHYTVGFSRGGRGASVALAPQSHFPAMQFYHGVEQPHRDSCEPGHAQPPPEQAGLEQNNGLLGDIVPAGIRKK